MVPLHDGFGRYGPNAAVRFRIIGFNCNLLWCKDLTVTNDASEYDVPEHERLPAKMVALLAYRLNGFNCKKK
jgi:hypothetical protein